MTAQVPEAAIQVENVVLRVRRHGRRLTLPVLLLIALAAASGFYIGALPEEWMNWVAALTAPILALVLLIPLFAWLSNRTTITDRRVIVRRGFFVQRRSEVPLSRVREVRSQRGPVQRMFGSGNVELFAGAEHPTVLRDVPRPDVAVDALQELIERNFQHATSHVGPGFPPGNFAADSLRTDSFHADSFRTDSFRTDSFRTDQQPR